MCLFAFKSDVMQVTIKAEALKLSKCKRVNFHSFKELNSEQHVFEWKTTLKREKSVKVANLIKIPTPYAVKNLIPHSFWSGILPLKNVLSSVQLCYSFFPLFPFTFGEKGLPELHLLNYFVKVLTKVILNQISLMEQHGF